MNDIVGLRFDPTEKEIIDHYLRLKMLGDVYQVRAINEVNVCMYEPWDLCQLSAMKSDSMWHFFCRRDFKYASGERVNRTTNAGYWKKTGNDKKIKKGIPKQVIGTKKNLVFHIGRSPKGTRTEWVMHEYHSTFVPPDKRSFVLCRLVKNENEENDGTPDVGHEPSSHAPSGNRNGVVDNEVSAPEVIGNPSQQTLVTENENCVVNNTVFTPEVMRNASERTLFTENGNFVVENTVSSPEGNHSIVEFFNYVASVPLEQLDTILSPAHEFQVQETVAPDDIPAKVILANNIEGALFNSGVNNNEGGDDIDLFLNDFEDSNHGEIETLADLFDRGNDTIFDHRTTPFGSAASQAAKRGVRIPQINVISLVESSDDSDHSTRSLFLPAASNTRRKQSFQYSKVLLQNSSDDSQDSPESRLVAASSPTTKKGVKMRGKSLGIGSPATKKGVNDSGDMPGSFSVAATSRAKKKKMYMQQKSSTKDTKEGSRTASPAKKSVYWQRECSLRTRSQDTTEGSSSSSSDTMVSLLRELKGMKLV